jgi:hypothetical protein
MLEGSTKDRPGLDDQKLIKENTLFFFVRIRAISRTMWTMQAKP